jgi:hypothetical protein
VIVLIPILLLIAFELAYEFYAMFTGKKLVTMYFRDAFIAVPGVFGVCLLLLGILIGHFVWYQ